jgi:hypothetical protein
LQVQFEGKELPESEKEWFGQATQEDSDVCASTVLYLPPAQLVQSAEPFTALYLPAIHAEQLTPSGPV